VANIDFGFFLESDRAHTPFGVVFAIDDAGSGIREEREGEVLVLELEQWLSRCCFRR
jgi:hypothetical protein